MNNETVIIRQTKNGLAAGRQAWVMMREGRRLGYATAAPVPGLPGLLALDGFIDPAWRRRGLGGRLLAHVLAALKQTHNHQVAHPVASLDSPAARFLLKHGFF
ncbi:MAG: GNAT family N-acetyltransferase, partial [Chloroflexota bacterium]